MANVFLLHLQFAMETMRFVDKKKFHMSDTCYLLAVQALCKGGYLEEVCPCRSFMGRFSFSNVDKFLLSSDYLSSRPRLLNLFYLSFKLCYSLISKYIYREEKKRTGKIK